MNRPLTSVEIASERRRGWYIGEENKARQSRGERGAMEFWLRLVRSQIAKDAKNEPVGREETVIGFALVCRLFLTALQHRETNRRIWDDLIGYADNIVTNFPTRDPK